ncbi:extracellular solute-binding protein [Facklamia sp. P9177]|uniref:extracellular solute-binding protein n=1 Tax=Facklamia sp. P9177 TaxID=3421945 RepID=UPI003D178533
MYKKFLIASMAVLSASVFTSTGLAKGMAQDEKRTVTIYSNTYYDDARTVRLVELAEAEGFYLEMVTAPGGDTYNRLLAEANDPQADVIIGMDEANWLNVQEQVDLHAFEPVWAENVPEEIIIGKGEFYPFAEAYIFGMYNPEFINQEDAVKTLEALGQEEALKNKYRIPSDLAGSTNQKIILSMLMQYRDDEGELGISEEGWQKVATYINNGYQAREGEDQWVLFQEGTTPYNYYHISGTALALEEYDGLALEPIVPTYGIFSMTEQIGILDKGEEYDYSAAEDFVNWYGSDEVQKVFAEEFGFLPVTEGGQEVLSEPLKALLDKMVRMDVDWDFYRQNVDSWVEKLELEYMP